MSDAADVDEFERSIANKTKRNYALLVGVGLVGLGAIGYKWYQNYKRHQANEEREEGARRYVEQYKREGANTPEERAAISAQLDTLTARADQIDAAFRSAVTAASATPPAVEGVCPVSLSTLEYREAASSLGPAAFAAEQRKAAATARAELAQGYFPAVMRNPPELAPETRYDLVLHVTARTAPTVTDVLKNSAAVEETLMAKDLIDKGVGVFTPGEVTGNVVLWDSLERRVICAGDVHARNASDLHVRYHASSSRPLTTAEKHEQATHAFERDLVEQTQTAIWKSLRAVR